MVFTQLVIVVVVHVPDVALLDRSICRSMNAKGSISHLVEPVQRGSLATRTCQARKRLDT